MTAAAAMWDTKRQIIWLATALIFGTVFLYPLARDEMGVTDWSYFALLELLLLIVVAIMFFIYSRKGRG